MPPRWHSFLVVVASIHDKGWVGLIVAIFHYLAADGENGYGMLFIDGVYNVIYGVECDA